MIYYGKQDISQQDIDEVVAVLNSDFLTQGPKVPLFEKKVCVLTNASYAVASNSATSALHIACLALGVKQGDIVWTSPNSFVASANCALYCNAKVDFVDIDPDTFNLCPFALEQKLLVAKANGKLPKVIIPVHFSGQSCDMKSLSLLAKEYGFFIIEDGSHAIGGSYNNQPIGSCEFSDICVFSFHPVKIITTAEGGMATTGNAKLAEKMKLFRSHGVTREVELLEKQDPAPWYYEQVGLGYNYRMTELQAALGISQLIRIQEFIERRRMIATRYQVALVGLDLHLPCNSESSAWHLFVIRINVEKYCKRKVYNRLKELGVAVNVHYIPIHLQPYYAAMGFKEGDFPHAEAYYQSALSIPLYPAMTLLEQDLVISTLKKVLSSTDSQDARN